MRRAFRKHVDRRKYRSWFRQDNYDFNYSDVLSGDKPIKIKNNIYKAEGTVLHKKLEKGMFVIGSYNSYNQGVDVYEIMGYLIKKMIVTK